MRKLTVLKTYVLIYLACCIVFAIANWKGLFYEITNRNDLSFQEGWGIIYLVTFIFIGLIGLIIDLILTKLIKDKRLLNGIELAIVIGFSMMLWIELK